jgi:hypothetical protein
MLTEYKSVNIRTAGVMHCKDTIPKIQNKYAQERKCAATVQNSYIYVCVSDLYIPLLGLSFSAAGK